MLPTHDYVNLPREVLELNRDPLAPVNDPDVDVGSAPTDFPRKLQPDRGGGTIVMDPPRQRMLEVSF